MQLQGRNLSLTMSGEDVKLLQESLRQLGFFINDKEGFFDKATFQAVHALQKEHGLPATGVVDETTAKLISIRGDTQPPKEQPADKAKDGLKQFVVQGHIRQADGSPLVGGIVRAVDKDVRSEAQLNETTTANDGHYEITYTSAQFRRAGKVSADLIVRVFNASGSLLTASPIIFNAQPEETVDLVIRVEGYRGPAEYERLVEELAPLLEDIKIEGIELPTPIDKIADLKEDEGHQEITFLAGETGKDPQHIAFLVWAAVLAKETGVALDGSTKVNAVPPEAFYGLFRGNLPTDLPSLLAYPPQVWRGALENALRDNIIPAKLSDQIDSIIERLQEHAVEQALRPADDKARASLGDVLSTSLLAQEQQKTLVKLYLTHKGPVEDFWKALGEHPEFKEHVDELQFTFQVSALTQNYLPFIRELQQMRQTGSLQSPHDLAKLDAQAWLGLANKTADGKPIGFPPDVEGKDDAEKAKAMARMIEVTFPTAAFAHQIETDSSIDAPFKAQEKEDLIQFFANNPDFAFDTAPISSYLSKNPNVLIGVKDGETLTQHLSSIQRLSSLTPYYEEWRPLLADQLHSAHSIVSKWGRTEFATKFGQNMGEERAQVIYDQADHRVAMTTLLYAKYAAAFNSVSLNATAKPTTDVAEIPNWRTLFGALDVCECEHCQSVYSAAAYLVDILSFLRRPKVSDANGTVPGETAKDVLFKRRPDIGDIELSCQNTDTPMPYVDLVNEILEQVVPPPEPPLPTPAPKLPGPPVPRPPSLPVPAPPVPAATSSIVAYQTSGTAEELSANPEHFNVRAIQAYQTLAQQVYPWDLPFDLWIEEARAYLEQLGVHRYELMETFHKEPPPSELTDIAIADEYLGLTTVEREIISGVSPKQPWEFWGLGKTDAIPDPADNTSMIQGSWIDILSRVHVFLKRSGLTYKELLDLLDIKFINANQALHIDTLASVTPEDKDTCDPSKLMIVALNKTALGRMQHFIRLWRKLGWTMDELDKALTALNPADVNPTFLLQLSHIQRLRSDLMVPLIKMLSWWAPIDTTVYSDESKSLYETKSLYEQLFLNKTVTNPVDDAFTSDALASNSGKISEHIPALLAALGISEADLLLLTKNDAASATLNLAESEIQDDMLNLANLSQIYRIVSFAKALKLSIRDFLLVKALIGINPFDAAHTENTLLFVEKVRKIRASGFTIAELDYLLRDHVVPPSRIAPTEESIALVLEDVRSGLQKIAADNPPIEDDPTGDITRTKLATLPDITTDLLAQAMALIDGTSTASAAERDQFIDAHFAVFLDPVDAKAKLVGPPSALTAKEDRFTYVLNKLLAYLASESFVKQKLSEALKLEVAAIEKLLNSPNYPAKIPIFLQLIESNVLKKKITAVDFSSQFQTYILLVKTATIISKFKMLAEELGWILEHGASLRWLDLSALPVGAAVSPVSTAVSPVALFAGWERLVDVFDLLDGLPLLRDRLPSDEWPKAKALFGLADDAIAALSNEPALMAVFDLAAKFNGANTADAERQLWHILSEHTGWNRDDLVFLVSDQGLGLTFPNAYKDERALKHLRACFVLIQRLGVSVSKVLEKDFAWTQPDVTSDVSRRIKQSVKATYDDDQWLVVAKPLRDILREKQRSSLVSYLVAHSDPSKGQQWHDSNGVYEYFLIDVEMDPCMITSRIKQAINSVQLFVQRCLMNLETEQVVFSPEAVREWKWMKNYRVWEANRKVFLYPENWIEPELRDNKSPFFKDLENELLQNEITKDSVEDAFAHYLEKLDEVARLEICGMYFQVEPHGDDHNLVVHVFGRTPGNPHVYYYRQWVDLAYWTAWEKVDLDIQGDHLIPVVYNRRLRLYWPIFTKKADENQPIPNQNATSDEREPIKHWEIKLAWSEYKHNKWSAKKVSIDTLASPLVFRYDRNGKKIDVPATLIAAVSQELVIRNDESLFTFKGLTIKPLEPSDPEEYLAIRCYSPDVHFTQPVSTIPEENPSLMPQFGWWPIGEFRLEGCHDEPLSFPFSGDKPLVYPFRSTIKNMMLVEDQEGEDPKGSYDADALYIISDPTYDAGDPILARTPGIFRLLYPHQIERFISPFFFYQDKAKTFFVIPKAAWLFGQEHQLNSGGLGLRNRSYPVPQLIVEMFYHPYVCEFIKQFNRYGVDGFLDPDPSSSGEESWPARQLISHEFFYAGYGPDSVDPQVVNPPYPIEEVDFSYGGSYSLYNWELFFHAPLLVADRLSKNQRFEEAQQWFHYIFDPTARFSQSERKEFSNMDPSARFWKVRPFFENADVKQTIEDLLKLLDYKGTDPDQQKKRKEFEYEVVQWQKYPFDPHLIARNRITAYQKTVIMKYIDNLIAWGDQLFRRDTIEAINEATQLYILAAEILGDRPQEIPPRLTVPAYTYDRLEPKLDDFSNKLVQVENLLPPPAAHKPGFGVRPPFFNPSSSFPLPNRKNKGAMNLPSTFYFCIPKNDNLLGYWDTVADRLFKIRHCMNIEGVVRELPLFEPPIDPALLVRAVAAGIDISSALNDLNAALPHYRFGTMQQKAVELCNDVKALGVALLSALEKRDAEGLALLRSSHEISVLKAVRQVREKQVDEAKDALEALKKGLDIANERYSYYNSREFMNAAEIVTTTLTSTALIPQAAALALDAFAGVAHLSPAGTAGASGLSSPVVTITYGGLNVGNGASSWADVARGTAAILHTSASLSSAIATYQRRADDWGLQKKLASIEQDQIKKQIAAAEIRQAIAEKELDNQDLQIENANLLDSYMHDKFTNQELYDWMVGQIAAVYFQSYQLAYDVAKRAEQAYHFELDLADANFIQFGYWDSLKKGLLAGEKLHYDLKRMEMAYLDQHKREYEITKHISLAMLDPIALVTLKETGKCLVDLPEALFDLDYPGHYMRRIKAVGLTIPCVTGPYTSVNCTLTLLKNSVRKTTLPDNPYARQTDDKRFMDSIGAVQSIVTSSAQNDSGLFETNLRDERYLPFEGAGAISEWRIELSQDFRQFDYNTISDVILHVRYTAREGGDSLKGKANDELKTILKEATLQLAENRTGLFRLFSAKHEFPDDWYRFLRPKEDQTDQSLQVNLDKERFPFQFRDETITITTVEFFLKLKGMSQDLLTNIGTIPLALFQATTLIQEMGLMIDQTLGGLYHAEVALNEAEFPLAWSITAREEDKIPATLVDDVAGHKRLKPDAIEDLVIVCHYTVQNEVA